jgi:hypothetical protein
MSTVVVSPPLFLYVFLCVEAQVLDFLHLIPEESAIGACSVL